MISIVNYGIGNIGSLLNMLRYIGVEANVENDPERLLMSKKLILPGVGSFDVAMNKINSITGMKEILHTKAHKEQVPILGICLGMQLMANQSEEGDLKGLGWIPGKVKRFPTNKDFKVPHMGWNSVEVSQKNNLTDSINKESRFYFVHSYYVELEDTVNSLLSTYHGIKFESGITLNNIYGLQFHPEKSHKYGMKILESFSKI